MKERVRIRNIDPRVYIDGLDQVGPCLSMLMSGALIAVPHQTIDTLTPGSEIYDRRLRALRKACGIYGILPSSRVVLQGLTLVVTDTTKCPFASGGFARNDIGQIFVIKHLRTYEADDLRHVKEVLRVCHSVSRYFSPGPLPQKYCKEVTVCTRVGYENVPRVEGVAPEPFEICIVSKWMDSVNILNSTRVLRGKSIVRVS